MGARSPPSPTVVMDPSAWFDGSFQQSETGDIDALVNAALCARNVFPLAQTIYDNR